MKPVRALWCLVFATSCFVNREAPSPHRVDTTTIPFTFFPPTPVPTSTICNNSFSPIFSDVTVTSAVVAQSLFGVDCVTGSLSIVGDVGDLTPLSGIGLVGGTVFVFDTPNLVDLSPLNFALVGGLDIQDTPAMTSLRLSSLQQIGSAGMTLENMPVLSDLSTEVAGLFSIGGPFNAIDLPAANGCELAALAQLGPGGVLSGVPVCDAGVALDGGASDAGDALDSGVVDAGAFFDAGDMDAGDAGGVDAGDAGDVDAGDLDAGAAAG